MKLCYTRKTKINMAALSRKGKKKTGRKRKLQRKKSKYLINKKE